MVKSVQGDACWEMESVITQEYTWLIVTVGRKPKFCWKTKNVSSKITIPDF